MTGATLTVVGESDFNVINAGTALINAGTFIHSGAGVTQVTSIAFNNSGAVVVQEGSISLEGGGSFSGSVIVSGGTLALTGGSFAFQDGVTVTGDGLINLSGSSSTGLAVNGNAALQNLAITGGQLSSSGNLTINDTLTWTAGQISGTGKVTLGLAASGTISGTERKYLYGRLESAGTLVYDGDGLTFAGSQVSTGTLTNMTGATLTVVGESDFNVINAGTALINAGTFIHSGAGVTQVTSIAFNNSGAVVVQEGSISLEGGGSFSAAFSVTGAGLLALSAGTFLLPTDSNGAVENLSINNSNLTGAGNLTVTGSLNWTGGTVAGTGKVTLTSTAIGSITGTSSKILGRTVENAGTLSYSGSSLLFGSNATEPGVVINLHGATFTVDGEADFSSSFSSSGNILSNAGIFIHSGVGTTLMNAITFNNSGIVNVLDGVLQFKNTGTHSGRFIVDAGGTLSFSVRQVMNGAVVQGDGTLLLSGAGSQSTPQVLEVAGKDVGNGASGFVKNNLLGALVLTNSYVRLVDGFDNSDGAAAEALYLNKLNISSGSTLDLNLVHVYTRSSQITGTVTGGSVNSIPDGGAIAMNTATPGSIGAVGEQDEWMFFGRAGQAVTVQANPGTSTPPAPFLPILDFAKVRILDPDGNVLATASSSSAGQLASLLAVTMPTDGTYRVQVTASADHASNRGNYMLTIFNVTVDSNPLLLNQQVYGNVENPFAVDRWTFAAAANQQVQLDLLASAVTGIVFDLVGPDGNTLFSNVGGDSGLTALTMPGSYTVLAHSIGGGAGAYSFRLVETAQRNLPLNTTVAGTLVGSGQAQLFRVAVPTAKVLSVEFDDATATDDIELYIKFGSPPTRSDYDVRSLQVGSADQSLFVPHATAGTWFVLVYAAGVPVPSTFTLRAETSDVHLEQVTPERYSTSKVATLTLDGAGFDSTTTVSLVGANAAIYSASVVSVDLTTQVTATFDLTGVAPGVYSVRVSRPGQDTDELASAFTVLPAGEARLITNLVVPASLGRAATATLYIEYANTGTAAMPAPLLVLQSADTDNSDRPWFRLDASRLIQNVWTSATPDGLSHSISILANGNSPGVLQPGESFRVPVYFAGLQQPWNFSDSSVELELRIFETTDTTPMDWTTQRELSRPDGMSAEIWDPIFANLVAQTGSSVGDYIRMLNDNARYLGQLGQRVVDVGQLWAFEILQANGLNPLSQLASSLDAVIATPGLTLGLQRSFGSSLASRYEVGPFGRGWATPWTTSLVTAADGSVTILGAGGSERRFQPDSRYIGTYFSDAGDYSQLKPDAGGTFTLREQSGLVTAFRADGKLDYLQDTNGNRITAGYAADRLITLTHSAGQSLALGYNGVGRIVSITSSDGHQATYSYDVSNQHLLSVQGADGLVTSYTYQSGSGAATEHALTSVGFPDGTHQFFNYDAQGRLANISRDANADLMTFSYDTAGRVSLTNSAAATTQIYFDHRGLVAKLVDALGHATYTAYDTNFNLTRFTDTTGASQSFTYDSKGNLTAYEDAAGQLTHLQYGGPFQRLLSLTDANGNSTSYSYDARGNATATTYANDLSEHVAYDAAGNAISTTNRRGQPISYTYDSAGRTTRQTFTDASHADFTYDGRGNLKTATDAAGTTTFNYDSGDRLTKVTYPNGRFLSYQYDAAGRRTRMVDQAGFTINYSYNSTGRLASLTDGTNGLIVSYTYNSQGRLGRKDQGNGTYTTYEYDAVGQLIHLINYAPDNAVNSRFDYTYDSVGQRISMATSDGTWAYAYDATGQLIRAVFTSTNPQVPNQDLSYEYDALGNRVRTVENGVETAYDTNELNEYTSVGAGTLTYDADGNLISESGGNRNASYAYDAQNRLVQVVTTGGTWNYEYDVFGNRTATVHNGQRTEYLLDPTGLVDVVGEFDGAGNVLAHYAQGLGLAGRFDASGNPAYYDFDAIGSTAGLTNATGNYVNRYRYMPFGETVATTESVTNAFEFVGKFGVTNEENGFDYMRARFFSEERGRLNSIDPEGFNGGQLNLYTYAANSPSTFLDPTGRFLFLPPLVIAAEAYATTMIVPAVVTTIVNNPEAVDFAIEFIKGSFDSLEDGSPPNAVFGNGSGANAGFVAAKLLNSNKEPIVEFLSDILGERLGNLQTGDYFSFLYGVPLPDLTGGQSGGTAQSFVPTARDPNELTGPVGYGQDGFVLPDIVFPYRIDFENDATATAPAQRVDITNTLNANLDPSTFELTEVGFGDVLLAIPAHSQYFQTAVPITSNGQEFEVLIEIGLDFQNNQVYAHFQSVDPLTSLPPDVLVGFLPPEDGTGRGQGHFNYTIHAKPNLPTGTLIKNIAIIQFDHSEIIGTNQIDPHDPAQGTDPAKEARNTIDAGTPSSQVAGLPATASSTSFSVSWSGQDDIGGSGVGAYDVYVGVDGGAYTLWQSGTAATSATYTGVGGHTYRFYSLAHDNVGHVEAAPETGDALTAVEANTAPNIPPGQNFNVAGNAVTGAIVGPVNATDSDLTSANNAKTFSISSGNGAGAFVINAQSGQITVSNAVALTGLAGQVVTLGITVTDGGSPALSASSNVNVTVANVNTAPVLANPGAAPTFVGKLKTPVKVFPTLTVTDADGSATLATIVISLPLGGAKKNLDVVSLPGLAALGNRTDASVSGRLQITITLKQGATNAAVQTMLEGLTFQTKGAGLKIASRGFQLRVTDRTGLQSNLITQTLTVRKK